MRWQLLARLGRARDERRAGRGRRGRGRACRPSAETLDRRALLAVVLPVAAPVDGAPVEVSPPDLPPAPAPDDPNPTPTPTDPIPVDPTDPSVPGPAFGPVSAPGGAADFVAGLYRHELGRDAAEAEVQGWIEVYARGGPEAVVRGICDSPEALARRVDEAFSNLVGRPAAPGEAETYLAKLREGQPEESVLADLLSIRVAADDGVFIGDLYRAVLGREASADEVDGWRGLAGTRGRRAVAEAFLASAEHRALRVTDAYREILGRDPDEAGLRGWVDSGLALADVRFAVWTSTEANGA